MTRLMTLFTAVALLGVGGYLLRDIISGSGEQVLVRIAATLILAVATAVLVIRKPLSLRALRGVEVVVFGILTANLATHAYFVAGALAAGASTAPTGWTSVLFRFALLAVAYGLFVPNKLLRGIVGVVLIALAPIFAAATFRLLNPETSVAFDAGVRTHLIETIALLATAAGIGMFAVFFTGNLFDFAYEQRRRTFYDLEERIGSGGMGEVWKAHHRTLHRPTALKLVREDKFTNVDREEAHRLLLRFEREAKATAVLRSPHTIEVYDYGVTGDGHFFYAMEYLQGLDLETLVDQYGALCAERVVHFLLQACDSLAEAHETGLTHRDIKPANLFLSKLGPSCDYIKLLDFGLVQHNEVDVEDTEKLTADGTTAGTPAFMAPEMALSPGDVDGRADLYALGAVAYWLLTGSLVFDAAGGVAMIVEHVRTAPTPPSERTELAIPAALESIVMKCLEKEPADRFQTANELAAALREVPLAQPWTTPRAEDWWSLRPRVSAA